MKLSNKKTSLTLFCIFSINILFGGSNPFLGNWSMDLEKTISENPKINKEQKTALEYYSNRISIEFFDSGNFSERIGYEYFIEGKWTKYKDDLVVVRCENDSQIKSTRDNLLQKIKFAENDKRKRIRLKQNLYRLNRFSVRTYYLKGGNIYSSHNFGGYELNLFFQK